MTTAPRQPLPAFLRLLDRAAPLLVRRSAHTRIREPRAVDRSLALVVREVRPEAEEVVSLRLATADGGPLPPWRPGAHLDLDLPSGRRRQYSLCGDPADATSYRIAVRRIPRDAGGEGGSRELHTLRPGATLHTQGPRNAFPLALTGGPLLFVAGGIGITPILPMARAAAAAGADWRLVYTGRSHARMPFLDELAALDPTGARLTVRTDDCDGVPGAAELLAGAGAAAAVYLCGPPALVTGVRQALAGRDATGLHVERFATPPVLDGAPFEVQLGPGGTVLSVPADRSALSVIAEARPGTAYSCRRGFCGTCRLRVLDGEVTHHGSPAARRTEDAMLICVSRAAHPGARLTLDC